MPGSGAFASSLRLRVRALIEVVTAPPLFCGAVEDDLRLEVSELVEMATCRLSSDFVVATVVSVSRRASS
jgi:hypothetical protein